MQFEVGTILDGKVTGITKFGAFVEFGENKVGMVHISEVSDTYVNDISEHLKEGQEVKVKVLSINEDGKIGLSIKKANSKPQFQRDNDSSKQNKREFKPNQNKQNFNRNNSTVQRDNRTSQNNKFSASNKSAAKPANSFEDMLSKFMQTSDEKISDLKKGREVSRRGGSRRSK